MRNPVPRPEWGDPVLNPQSFGDARANLEHTLALFDGEPDDRMVLIATSNVYGDFRTGLTMRDLRLIATYIGAAGGTR